MCAISSVMVSAWLDGASSEDPLLIQRQDCCECFVMATDRRSQAVAELMGEGQLDVSRRQELSVVLNCDQTCVQGGGLAVPQGGLP